MLTRPARPIRTLHLDDLVLLVAKCLSGLTHFVIHLYTIAAALRMVYQHTIPRFSKTDKHVRIFMVSSGITASGFRGRAT